MTTATALPTRASPLAALALMLTACIFAANHVAARVAFNDGVSVVTAVAVRSATAAAALGLLLAVLGVSPRLRGAQRWQVWAVGALLATQSVCLYSAVARLPVALALLAFNSFPIFIALFSWWVNGRKPPKALLWAMPVILLGLALALDVTGAASRMSAADRWATLSTGVAFALSASASFSLGMVLAERWLGGLDARVRTAWVGVVMTVFATGAGLALSASLGAPSAVAGAPMPLLSGFAWPHSATGWAALASLAVLYSAAFALLFTLLPKLGAAGNSPLLNVEPIAALVLAWLLLGQAIAPLQLLGAALVVSAVMWLGFRKR
jgi:drug/metabolite transporter (DMT)-like permease